ncbi:MAG: DNA replication/repair protein RecF [Acidimicrobiales bacterium]
MATTILSLDLASFRNLESVVLRPSPNGLTVIKGDNGVGKTSLLEAIVYCSTLRSFRGVPREAVIANGKAQAHLHCVVLQGARDVDISVEISTSRRDRVQMNGQRVGGARDLLEVLQTTLFTPDDLELAKGPPSLRRGLLDDVISAASPRLAAEITSLERILRQRNALLRQLGGRLRADDVTTLAVWDERLAETGERISAARTELLEALEPHARTAFAALAPGAGTLELCYLPSYEGSLVSALAAARHDDLRRQVTTVGPQRDDVGMSAGGLDARNRLSQGRQRCVALALRLASHEYLTAATGMQPVLLLDDAFSELDDKTARALVNELPTGQALLTTAGSLPPGSEPDLVFSLVDGVIS